MMYLIKAGLNQLKKATKKVKISGLQPRTFTHIGPYLTDVKLTVTKVGDIENGTVHQMCAPSLYITEEYEKGAWEIVHVPQEIMLRRNKQYTLAAYANNIEYTISGDW
ncbi:hypothetical protein WSM22_33570 [Cytophagales bacterium WSM2-2]|nr:hypothetical protein WSM22_33570 [Cytophagales bacterium WSM2-2]